MALKDAWAIPEFRRLLIGNGVNMLGSSIFIIGMGWTIAQVGGAKAYGWFSQPISSAISLCFSTVGWSSTGCRGGQLL